MKRFPKWAGYLLLPIIIIVLTGLLTWESLSYYALKKALQFFAVQEHIALDVHKINGKLFSETTIINLSLRPEDGQPQAYQFKVETISCNYNLWDLREGVELFLQGLSCTAGTPEFVQDLTVSMGEDEVASELKMFHLPAVLPRLDVQNGIVILTNTGWDAEIREINAGLRSAAAAHELLVDVGNFRFSQGDSTRVETSFRSKLLYSDARLSIDSLELGEHQISAAGFIDLEQIDKGITKFTADLVFAESQLNISGSMEDGLLHASARIENFDIGELQKRLGGSGWDIHGKIRGNADLDYNLESRQDFNGSFALDVQEGQLHGVDVEDVSLAGSFDNEIFNVSTAEARTFGNQILISDVSVPMQILQEGEVLSIIGGAKAKFEVDITESVTLLKLFKVEEDVLLEVVRPNSLTINGYLEKGSIYLDDAKAATSESSLTIEQAIIPIPATPEAFEFVPIDITGRFESSNLNELAGLLGDLPFNGQTAADIRISGTIKEPKAAINLSGDVGYKDLQMGSLALQGEVQLIQKTPGTLKSAQFTVTELTQTNDAGILTLVSPATGAWQQDKFSLDASFQLDGQGEAAIVIERTPEKEIAVEITTRNLNSDGWLGNFVDNRYFFHGADIEAAITGLPNNLQLQLGGSVSEAGETGVPFPLTGSFSLQYSAKGIEISEFTWKSHARNQLTLTGFLPYDPRAEEPFLDGDLSLKGHVDFPALEDIAVLLEPWGIGRGSVSLDMDVSGSWNQPEGYIQLQAEAIEPPDTMKQYMDSSVDLSCAIAAEGKTIVLKSASLVSAAYSAQATGSWQHGLSVRKLLQKREVEFGGEVSADAGVQFRDLNFLRQKLPWLRRLEGDMQGELHVSGPITDPSVSGSFSFKDGEASHTFNFPMLSAINIVGDFDEHSITIKNMQVDVGGSPVNLSGSINKDKETVAVNLHVDGRNVLLFRNNDMRMRGDVELDVSGPLERLLIKGTTGLTGGYYTGNIDFLGKIGSSSAPVSEGVGLLFSFPEPPLKNAVLDISVSTIEPFRIRNNLIRGVLRPELSLKGTGELPFLVGTVYIDPSRVLLPSGRLQIQSGLLRFPAGKPDRPELDLLAQSKVLGYDINVITRGPLEDPIITLSSSPALPNDDLLLLLLTGQPPKEDVAGGAKSSGTTNVMVYLGRDFLSKWLEDESGASDESILDRFELDYGRNITRSGEQTVEGTFRLSELKTGQRKVYYLSGEKDKYDAYNYGLKVVFRFE